MHRDDTSREQAIAIRTQLSLDRRLQLFGLDRRRVPPKSKAGARAEREMARSGVVMIRCRDFVDQMQRDRGRKYPVLL